jgi:ribonuclease-3
VADIADLSKALGVKFKKKALLRQALVHSSYINENPSFSPGNNERLELLGDAVLGLVVAEELYRSSPDLEAVIAAVYLDRGLKAVADIIARLFASEWPKLARPGAGADFKSRLQELTQSRFQQTPVYRLVAETGRPHAPVFTVEVTVKGEVLGSGSGRSKKLAETEAAREALDRLSGGFTE